MNYPCVKLFLGENISFPWNSSLKEFWDTDLEAFLYQCRTAISSIEAELEQRRKDVHPKKTMGFKSLSGRLQNCAERIKITHILNNQQAANVKTAVEIMTTNQTTRFEKIYQDVLNDISRLCGPEVVLLCAAALGKHKISHLNQDDRAHLLDYLTKQNSTLPVDRLKVLVNNYKVPCRKPEPNGHPTRKRTWTEGPGLVLCDPPCMTGIPCQNAETIHTQPPENRPRTATRIVSDNPSSYDSSASLDINTLPTPTNPDNIEALDWKLLFADLGGEATRGQSQTDLNSPNIDTPNDLFLGVDPANDFDSLWCPFDSGV